jgi:hypothetical protein
MLTLNHMYNIQQSNILHLFVVLKYYIIGIHDHRLLTDYRDYRVPMLRGTHHASEGHGFSNHHGIGIPTFVITNNPPPTLHQ